MKHLLLLAGLLALVSTAQAQIAPLANGLSAATTLLLRKQRSTAQQKATLFVTPATYQAHSFPQKRTPARKLPGDSQGGPEITAIEQLLAGRYAALLADSTSLLLGVAQEKEFSRLRTNLEAFNAFWNTDPYSAEMSFYRQHDVIRQRLAPTR